MRISQTIFWSNAQPPGDIAVSVVGSGPPSSM